MQTMTRGRTDARERETGNQVAEFGDDDVRRAWADKKRDCAEAEYFLGECHDFGEHGLSKDYALARYWYERAARNGTGLFTQRPQQSTVHSPLTIRIRA